MGMARHTYRPLEIAFVVGGLTEVIMANQPHGALTGWGVGLLTWIVLSGWVTWVKFRRGRGRVLIVEEDNDDRGRLVRFFSQSGWRTSEAMDAHSARIVLNGPRRYRPDWIIMGLILPDESGQAVLRYARTLIPTPRVAVTTQYSPGTPAWAEAEGLGADFVLQKPIQVNELMKMMEARL